EDLAERLQRTAIGRLREADRNFARHPLPDAVERRDLRRQNARRLLVPFELAPDQDERAGLDQPGGALVRFGECDDLDAPLRVFEREDGHPIALAGLERAARGDDAAYAGIGLDRLRTCRRPAIFVFA